MAVMQRILWEIRPAPYIGISLSLGGAKRPLSAYSRAGRNLLVIALFPVIATTLGRARTRPSVLDLTLDLALVLWTELDHCGFCAHRWLLPFEWVCFDIGVTPILPQLLSDLQLPAPVRDNGCERYHKKESNSGERAVNFIRDYSLLYYTRADLRPWMPQSEPLRDSSRSGDLLIPIRLMAAARTQSASRYLLSL